MLTFLEVGFGGNLVQGFRVYAWRAVPSFPQIALWCPSLAFWPQPFPFWFSAPFPNQIHEFYGFHQFSLFHPINSISYQWRISPTFPTLGEYLPDECGEVMRIVCWGQTVDSGATGASNLVMQPLGPRGSFLKHEVQDSENLKNWHKKHGKLTWKVLCPHQMLHL